MQKQIPSQSSNSTNPLSEASETSLDELMSRDPEGLTSQNIDQIINALRAQRAQWAAAEAAGAIKMPKGKAPVGPKKTAGPEIDLSDLGL